MTTKVTGQMLKDMIKEVLVGNLPEQAPLPVKPADKESKNPKQVKSFKDFPNAWDSEAPPVLIDLNEFDGRTEQEILQDQVKQKWSAFKKTLSLREQATLANLLGLDVKRYSVEELERLQGALKGKLPPNK